MTVASRQESRKDRGGPNLSRMVAASLIVHLVALALLVVLPGIPQRKRIFYAPVMTVSFVEPQLPRASKSAVVVKKAKPVLKKAKPVAKVSKKRVPRSKPARKAKVVRARPKRREVAKRVTRQPVKRARRLDLAARKPAKLISSSPAKPKLKPKRSEAPPVESVSQRETKQKQPASKKEEQKKIEERRRQWMAQQQERERALLSKTRESLKEPEPVPKPASSPRVVGVRGGSVRPALYNLRFKLYLNMVRKKVHIAWVLPDGLTDERNLITIVAIKIRRDGTLADTRVEEGSGNRRYDDTVLRAIAKAAPLPALPEEYEGEYMELGFRFRPEGVE